MGNKTSKSTLESNQVPLLTPGGDGETPTGEDDVMPFEKFEHYAEIFQGKPYDWWFTKISKECKNLDRDMQRMLLENLKKTWDDYAFVPKRLFSSTLLMDRNLSGSKDSILCYKVARLMMNGQISLEVCTLITLAVPLQLSVMQNVDDDTKDPQARLPGSQVILANGITGEKVLAKDLVPGQQYVCREAHVTGISFLGVPSATEKCYRAYRDGKGYAVSNFDPSFRYMVGHQIVEPSFGEQGRGCVQGIHFYTDQASALRYAGKGFTEKHVCPILTSPLNDARDVDDPDLANFKVVEPESTNAQANSNDYATLLKAYHGNSDVSQVEVSQAISHVFGSYWSKHNFIQRRPSDREISVLL
jgi:hypothetical protein